MKAAIFHEFGPPEVLRYEDAPDPEPGPGQVIVKVHAVTVNRTLDCAVRAGTQMQRNPILPGILGVDPSGEVVALGAPAEGVTMPKIGDRVSVLSRPGPGEDGMLGVRRWGGDAELVKVHANCCLPISDNLNYHEASVVIRHCPTAFHLMFTMGELKKGQWVLVMGCSGGLGSIGVQIAKMVGANVIGAAGSAERARIGLDLGADYVVNYGEQDLTEEVMSITKGHGVDLVYDNISNPETWPKAFAAIAHGGRLVTAGSHAGPVVPLDCFKLYDSKITIMGSAGSTRQNVEDSLKAAAEGKIKVVIEKVYPLSGIVDAHRLVEAGSVPGKVILDPTLG
ncbi:MAG: zinc-binding dehydrogenase [Alphaproteobacteria bacterium]|nr:zinc-binding dehydrogenase [Alphaproteobacteria bacterium]